MKKFFVCISISIILAIGIFWAENSGLLSPLELKLYDLQMNLRKPPRQDAHIVFVEMDEKAINNLGRWPWKRNIFANIIDTLDFLGAEQVLLDVTFNQPTPLILHREELKNVFQGKDDLASYINQEIGVLKKAETVSSEQALFPLKQIQNGFSQYTNACEQKLSHAVEDNDKILAQSLNKENVLIGYSFKILKDKNNIKKTKEFHLLKDKIKTWITQNPRKPFSDLPEDYKKGDALSTSEIEKIFLHCQIFILLENNIRTTIEEASQQLLTTPEFIRKEFSFEQQNVIEHLSLNLLKKAGPSANAKDLIFENELFSPSLQEKVIDIFQRTKREYLLAKKVAHEIPPDQQFLHAYSLETPILPFIEDTGNLGFLNAIPNQDGTLRDIPLFVDYQNQLYPHISLALILNMVTPQKISFAPGKYLILHKAHVNSTLKEIMIPIDDQAKMLINWTGKFQKTFIHTSCADIYRFFKLRSDLLEQGIEPESQEEYRTQKRILKEMIQNKICIIGLTAVGTHDYNPIPYEPVYPMVGTHGNIINSILTDQYITKIPDFTNHAILIIVALIVGIYMAMLSATGSLILLLIMVIGLSYGSLWLFNQGIQMTLSSPLLLSILSCIGISYYKFITEEKDKRQIKATFAKCVSPDIMEEIVKDPSKLQLGGVKKEITVLFSDIRGFTSYSEKRDPEEVISILNEYLNAMTKVIFQNKGTLDKYVGDEIMALFGAPKFEPPEISAKRAVITAIKMLEELKTLHKKWINEGLEPLDIGIGINTEEMVVGYIGSELRMDYTVIGDAVNLGARVEALTRDYQCAIIITETVYKYVRDIATCEALERIKVKGKTQPVLIYKVTGLKTDHID